VSPGRERKRILIVGEEPSARDEMRILLGSAGCECTIATNLQQGLATMDQKKFDAIILDSQPSKPQFTEMISRINQSDPNLLKRLILVTEEERDSQIKDWAERHSLPRVQRKFLLHQLWGSLELLFRPDVTLQNVAHVARLISDSLRGPLLAGVRASYDQSRKLLYASGSLTVGLLLEPETDSSRIALTGQILDSAKPDRRFEGIPVTLQGWKGLVARATAGDFGEFRFDFNFESIVSLLIRFAETHSMTILLPALARARRRTGGTF
jgi:CheY-like chemotaxis protein